MRFFFEDLLYTGLYFDTFFLQINQNKFNISAFELKGVIENWIFVSNFKGDTRNICNIFSFTIRSHHTDSNKFILGYTEKLYYMKKKTFLNKFYVESSTQKIVNLCYIPTMCQMKVTPTLPENCRKLNPTFIAFDLLRP